MVTELYAKLTKARKREINDLRSVLSTKEGRRFVMRVLEAGRPFQANAATDPIAMAFNEGQRNVSLRFVDDVMDFCFKEWGKAREEYIHDQRTEIARREAAAKAQAEEEDSNVS